jgi:serine O-acetyltransferase
MMKENISADLYRYFGQTNFKTFCRCMMLPGFRYTYFFRKAALHKKKSLLGVFYRLLLRRYMIKYGIQIGADTQIGKGLHIYHFGAIVVSPGARIGKNCSLSSCITIGQANRGSRKGYPTLGDRVFVGGGAVIVGNVTIGDNVLIAPNAYVNVDVPSNSIAIGNPARIIPDEYATQDYIVNVVGEMAENSFPQTTIKAGESKTMVHSI